MISYNPLWKTLIDKNMKKTDLIKLTHISNGTLAKLGKNESVSLSILDKICIALDCEISDIVQIKKEQ